MSKEDDIRLDQKVRAAWMYYIAGQNQSEIASQLGTSRPVVQRLIAAAKEEGIVSINLHHPVANCLDYAQLLQEKYRLIECNVVPAFSEESTLDSVSFGCYQLMARYLQDDKEKIIGLGSGLTLKKALQRIDFDSLNTRCVALISAMNADGQCNYYDDVPLLLTRKIKAKYYHVAFRIDKPSEDLSDAAARGQLIHLRLIDKPVFKDRTLRAQGTNADKNHVRLLCDAGDAAE